MKYRSGSEKSTFEAGKNLAAQLSGGDIVTLDGDLGAGKTVFAKGIAAGLGILESVLSPTFTLVNEYIGKKFRLYHFDAYRLSGADEATEAGLGEYFDDARGICVVEWHKNLGSMLSNRQTVSVRIDYIDESTREITIDGQ